MKLWIAFVIGAGLCWGTYVPLIAFGGKSLASSPNGVGNRLAAIMCVGGAYVLLAILIPLAVFMITGTSNYKPTWNGFLFASMAGVAGALGAICVVFATANATQEDRLYIAPIIFALAPIINSICSLFWHPTADNAWHFDLPKAPPGMLFYAGILLAALGTFLVLYSKEASEAPAVPPSKPVVTTE